MAVWISTSCLERVVSLTVNAHLEPMLLTHIWGSSESCLGGGKGGGQLTKVMGIMLIDWP